MTGVRTRLVAWLALTVVWALVGPAAAGAATNNIFTVAGTGTQGSAGDGGPATAAQLNNPVGVAVTADGGFLVADQNNHRIRRVSPAGTITTVAGTGTGGFAGDGGPATGAQLNSPIAVAVTADGGFLVVDNANHRIRRVSPAGTITTVAGTGTPGSAGDGGPATAAQLNFPGGVAVTGDGGFLIGGGQSHRIRRVSPAGTITTVAGTGTGGFAGDGGPATAAQLNFPGGVAVTVDGGFLVADIGNARIRRVSPAGTITTVAGTGTAGFAGDGGPATAAQFNTPGGVAVTADGGFLVADRLNHRIRRVSPAGTITTVAGTGTAGFGGDGGPATAAQLNNPTGVVATVDGGFLIADLANHRIRFVDADLRGPSSGPPGPGGPAGSQGPAGPAGLQGATGPSGAVRLAAALADSRYRARRGRSLRLRYVVTRSARVTLDVLKGRKRVSRKVANAAAGRNQIRLRAPKKTGRYTLRFAVRSSDGQATSDSARLTVGR